MTTRNDPQGALIGNIGLALEALEKIKAHLEDHLGAHPDEVHWGHVGSAGKAAEDLQELARFLGVK